MWGDIGRQRGDIGDMQEHDEELWRDVERQRGAVGGHYIDMGGTLDKHGGHWGYAGAQ